MEFDSFDLSVDESVLITQPNASAWFIGNVVGGSPTAIFGNITANGRIALVNASGVILVKRPRSMLRESLPPRWVLTLKI